MRTRSMVGALAVLSAVLLGCYALQKPRVRDCPIEDLLLDAVPFGGDAAAGELTSPVPDAPEESAGRTIYLARGIANHDVYHYKTSERAAQKYRSRRKVEFSDGMGGPWEVPREVTYRSPVADQHYVACGEQSGVFMCKLVAQYEEYYVFMNAHMSEEAMTFEDLERVLQAIDQKMDACLQRPLPTAAGENMID